MLEMVSRILAERSAPALTAASGAQEGALFYLRAGFTVLDPDEPFPFRWVTGICLSTSAPTTPAGFIAEWVPEPGPDLEIHSAVSVDEARELGRMLRYLRGAARPGSEDVRGRR